jgi:hypothetical protein
VSNLLKKFITQPLLRKMITASIAGTLYALAYGLIFPNPWGLTIDSFVQYLWHFTSSASVYFLFVLPVFWTYGIITSLVSDCIAHFIAKVTSRKIECVSSALIHMLFGWVLLWISLFASILFFFTDRILGRRDHYGWAAAVKSLVIPIAVWVVLVSVIWIKG